MPVIGCRPAGRWARIRTAVPARLRAALAARHPRRLQEEGGFVVMAAMMVLLVASVLAAASLTAASDDVTLQRNDLDQKKAFYAAQAGIADYEMHLNQDVNYWSYCTSVPTPNALNQAGATTNRLMVPGSTDESYAIELVPATSQVSCNTASPITSMIESTGAAAGTFRIRVTGYSRQVQRTIVATFRRKAFLDYVYYTVYETLDPNAYSTPADRTTAASTCNTFWRDGRVAPTSGTNYCAQIFFGSGDTISGPLHTEDELAICGSPTLGRSSQDMIEVVAPSPGYSNQGNASCAATPNLKGTYLAGASSIQPPPTNAQLKAFASASYQWTGQTHITLSVSSGTSMMTVTNNGQTYGPMAFPSNGVVYVSTSSCNASYTPYQVTYPGPSGCGTVTVDGTYNGSLTIASDNDIVIDGNLVNSGSGLLGLIANNFIRIYHPCNYGTNTNSAGSLSSPTIQAAVAALNHSFVVDNYNCGAGLGSLNVTGAIAQYFRGPVATFNSSGALSSGYLKSYTYDDRLRSQEPPHFIDPVQAAWRVQRETECSGSSC